MLAAAVLCLAFGYLRDSALGRYFALGLGADCGMKLEVYKYVRGQRRVG